MVDGGLALALLVIGAFALFVVWGKTPGGRQALRETFGEPGGASKAAPSAQPKRRAPAGGGKAAVRRKSAAGAKRPTPKRPPARK